MTLTTITVGNMILIMTPRMTTISHMTALTRMITINHTINMVLMTMRDSMIIIMIMVTVFMEVVMVVDTVKVPMVVTCMLMILLLKRRRMFKVRILELKNIASKLINNRNKAIS